MSKFGGNGGKTGRERTWWTRERVLRGLQRFYQERGVTPLSTGAYAIAADTPGKGHARRYPSFSAVLNHFSSFREAWRAVGLTVNRTHEEWSEVEDWYLREANGLLSRRTIAADLDRTPSAVQRRLYDLGLHGYRQHGWTLNRVEQVAGLSRSMLDGYLARGEVPSLRGNKCIYVDPADLLVVVEIDWQQPPEELARAVRQSLLGRLATVLNGMDWRVGRPYTFQPIRTTGRRWQRRPVETFTPRPLDLECGDQVQCRGPVSDYPSLVGRSGVVKGVFYRAHGQGDAVIGRIWVARVEFPKERQRGEGSRVRCTVPIAVLEKIPQSQVGVA